MDREELTIYLRRMPHWRLPGATYLVTWRANPAQRPLSSVERDLVASALRHFDGERYLLLAYVVVDDHVHVLVKLLENFPLQNVVHSWKSFTANRLQRESGRLKAVWQEDYINRIIRDEEEFLEKAQYILNNPIKRWPDLKEYPWVYLKQDLLAGTEARPTDE